MLRSSAFAAAEARGDMPGGAPVCRRLAQLTGLAHHASRDNRLELVTANTEDGATCNLEI